MGLNSVPKWQERPTNSLEVRMPFALEDTLLCPDCGCVRHKILVSCSCGTVSSINLSSLVGDAVVKCGPVVSRVKSDSEYESSVAAVVSNFRFKRARLKKRSGVQNQKRGK